jgi:hypothetical protein
VVPARKYAWFKEWDSVSKIYFDPVVDNKKLTQILSDRSRTYVANALLVLVIVRNFSVHIFNDSSSLFLDENYSKAFTMCLEALYILANA